MNLIEFIMIVGRTPEAVRILKFLASGEKAVYQVKERIGRELVSTYLARLQRAGILESDKRVKFRFYRIRQDLRPEILEAIRLIGESDD